MPHFLALKFSRILVAVLLLSLFTTVYCSDNSFGPEFTITSFNANITIHKNSAVTVEETFELELRELVESLWRELPADFLNKQGENVGVYISTSELCVDSQRIVKPVVDRLGSMVRIQLPTNSGAWGKSRYQLKYTIENAVQFLSEGDQFIWDIVGKKWRAETRTATATIQFDPDLVVQDLEIDCNTGSLGYKTGDCLAEVVDGNIVYSSTRALRAFEGLTLTVYLKQGTLTPPSEWQQLVWHYNLRSNWLFALPLASLLTMIWRWTRKRRLLQKPPIVRSLEEVPSFDGLRLSPADVGVIYSERFSELEITATIFDLANRGLLQLKEKIEPRFLDFIITSKSRHGESPTDFERKLVGIAQKTAPGQEPLMSSFGDTLFTEFESLRSNIESSLVKRGYLHARPAVFGRQVLIIAAVLMVATLILGLQFTELHIALIVPLAIFAAIPMAAIAFFDTVKTKRGVQAYHAILGLENYLTNVTTSAKSAPVSPEKFAGLVPYAIVLDLLGDWAAKNRNLRFVRPDWYESQKSTAEAQLTPEFYQGVARSIIFRLLRSSPIESLDTCQDSDVLPMPKAPTQFGSKILFRKRERR